MAFGRCLEVDLVHTPDTGVSSYLFQLESRVTARIAIVAAPLQSVLTFYLASGTQQEIILDPTKNPYRAQWILAIVWRAGPRKGIEMEAETLQTMGETLLIVDDEPLMTELFEKYMSKRG